MNMKTTLKGTLLGAFAAGFMMAGTATTSQAGVVAHVDLSSQTMRVKVNGKHYATWKISSGRGKYRTPTGTWGAKWLSKHHKSRKYNNAPMPYSVFYNGGYAVHGTYHTKALGRPASHGCIRLHTANARQFYNLVAKYGLKRTRVKVRH